MLLWHLLCSGDFASPLKPHSLFSVTWGWLSEREPSVSSIYVKKVKLSRFCCWTRGCGSYRFSHVVPFYSMPLIALSIGYLLLARGSCHVDSQGMWVYCHLGLSPPLPAPSDIPQWWQTVCCPCKTGFTVKNTLQSGPREPVSSTTFFPLCVFHFHFKLKKASSKRHNPIHSYIFVLTDQDSVPTVTSEWLFLFVLYIYLFSDMQLKCLDPSFCMYCISQREWFKACRSVSKSICIKICLQWACFTQSGGSWREWDNDLSEVWENGRVQSLWVWVNHAGESSGFCKSQKWKGVPAAGWKNKQTNTNISFKPAWLPLNFSLFNIFYTYVFSTDFLLLELLIIFSNTAQQIEKLRNFSIW